MADPSLLLIHGAATGAWVWDAWRRHLTPLGWRVNVLDLRGHGRSLPVDFDTVTFEDYLSDVESVAPQIAAAEGAHPVVGGWSLGGLLAMLYAAKHQETPALVLFSPAPPLEVGGKVSLDKAREVPLTALGPEWYGIHPDDFDATRAALPDLTEAEVRQVMANSEGAGESGLARRQVDRGLSVPAGSIRAPSLVIYGEEDTGRSPDLNRRLALFLGGDSIAVPSAAHWGIVYNEQAVSATAPKLDAWLARVLN
jgi:pimeloyl-ACP methyl ester carboxylesterase